VQIYYDLDHFKALNPVVTIGTFDGVHLGHQEVISELNRISRVSGGESVVFTFEPHPRVVVLPREDSIRLLSTIEEKIVSMEKLGIDHLVIYPFTEEFSKLTYDEFVTNILVAKMKLSCLVVGYDHRFGQGRKGDFAALEALSTSFNFKVEQLSQFLVNDKLVSSSKIRAALESGDILGANHYLGYEYQLSGKVVEGNKMGRRIGFPTANIEISDTHKMVPGDGVYAVNVTISGKIYGGMCNIGFRPTVNSNVDHKSIEVHIFNFEEDIYGMVITLNFIGKIRDEHKFSSIYELQEQLSKDKVSALNLILRRKT
jgi:riboflavin kinase/FMN adenylyltransferase